MGQKNIFLLGQQYIKFRDGRAQKSVFESSSPISKLFDEDEDDSGQVASDSSTTTMAHLLKILMRLQLK